MAQWERALAALPRTWVQYLAATWRFMTSLNTVQRINALFLPPQISYTCDVWADVDKQMDTQTWTHTHTANKFFVMKMKDSHKFSSSYLYYQ